MQDFLSDFFSSLQKAASPVLSLKERFDFDIIREGHGCLYVACCQARTLINDLKGQKKNMGKRAASRKKKQAVDPPLTDSSAEHVPSYSDRLASSKWALPVILLVLCGALYAGSLTFGLVDFDDDVYIFEDTRLEHLSIDNLRRIFTKSFFANYHPVTTLTYAMDRAVWKDWVPGLRTDSIRNCDYLFGPDDKPHRRLARTG